MSGHSGHNEPLDKSWPSHHFKANKNSLGSKWRPTQEKNGSNQSFDFIKDFKSSVKSLCD